MHPNSGPMVITVTNQSDTRHGPKCLRSYIEVRLAGVWSKRGRGKHVVPRGPSGHGARGRPWQSRRRTKCSSGNG